VGMPRQASNSKLREGEFIEHGVVRMRYPRSANFMISATHSSPRLFPVAVEPKKEC
jgi:hypothetical protein